ncbi:dipeptidase [Nisaea acidiphila]|uniref:Dipeptidase n=1 Tax=Nisaea acidiphila TaxID=1862145 RepID=A0A9J7ATH6_9PROT|nr:dipeptidase [Nisaea acidiphila]UUX50640.1 dipeptidase [Nisaea acidiphila]
MTDTLIPIFDGHNDTLLRLVLGKTGGGAGSFFEQGERGHIDLPRARKGGFCGGLFAMFTPSRISEGEELELSPRDPANFAPVSQAVAEPFTQRMIDMARSLEERSRGTVVIAHSIAEARRAMSDGKLAVILHIEGVECLKTDLSNLHGLYQAGLRSLGPVWSRKNDFGDGVPMSFPSSPDTGSGLTEAGENLIRACNTMGIMVDLSHITEKGFWDVARLSTKPLVASHSNVHAICPSPRNLTDAQLEAIRASGGLVGVNFHVGFLRTDGQQNAATDLDQIVAHTDYLLEKLGEDGVAFGSDFDGCTVPDGIGDVTGLPHLIDRYRLAGYGEELIRKIAAENWLSLLARTGI